MNGTEQRTHTTAVRSIGRRLDDIETVIQGLAAQIVKDRESDGELWSAAWDFAGDRPASLSVSIRLDVLQALTNERWEATCAAVKATQERQDAFRAMTFWQRLRWNVVGR